MKLNYSNTGKKLIAVGLISTMLMTNLVACGKKDDEAASLKRASKDDIIKQYEQLKTDYNDLSITYNELLNSFSGEFSANQKDVGIKEIGDGTGRFTLSSNDAKIYFSKELVFPHASEVSASGSISITKDATIQAADNWITNLSGSELTLEHTSGISGTVKIGSYTDDMDMEYIKDKYLPTWVEDDIPPTECTYSYIFLKGSQTKLGAQVAAPTTVDGKDATLRCGVFGYMGVAVSYVFVYRGTKDNTKDELIKTVLNSIQIGKNSVTFDS